jgi:hypothetical protein
MIGALAGAAFFVAAILIWLLFPSGGYKRQPLDEPPGPGWTFTGERFVDPKSGAMLDVWYCAKNGERAYVRAGPSPSG